MSGNLQIQHRARARQAGAAMVIALVMLLVLTLLATASARMTLLEERMTGNTQDRNNAFQAAEQGLRAGEAEVQVPVLADFSVNQDGYYQPAAPGDAPIWEEIDWSADDKVLNFDGRADMQVDLGDADVTYVVEQLPRVPTPGESLVADATVEEASFYRVTSRGVGVGGIATVTLQSTFKR